MVRIFVVACNFCGRKQKTWTIKQYPIGRYRICVFCGKSFKIDRRNLFTEE